MSTAKLLEALRKGKLTYGTRETLRKMKKGKVKVVFVAEDCHEKTRESIVYYAGLGKVDVISLKQKARDIAQVCKKNFPVSVLSTS
jgi:large subunit ribosomal protein L30e